MKKWNAWFILLNRSDILKEFYLVMKKLIVATFFLLLSSCNSLGDFSGSNGVPATGQPAFTPAPQFAALDSVLQEATTGHLAYTAPTSAQIGETLLFKLLLSPVQSAEELENQLQQDSQSVVVSEIKITPSMKAELFAADPDAFIVQGLHDDPIQLILDDEATEWSWTVTPKKQGNQVLVLSVYRLVQFNGSDSWRLVQTYQSNVNVKVTAWQWAETVDWKWVVGIVLTLLSMPIARTLFERRKNRRAKK